MSTILGAPIRITSLPSGIRSLIHFIESTMENSSYDSPWVVYDVVGCHWLHSKVHLSVIIFKEALKHWEECFHKGTSVKLQKVQQKKN